MGTSGLDVCSALSSASQPMLLKKGFCGFEGARLIQDKNARSNIDSTARRLDSIVALRRLVEDFFNSIDPQATWARSPSREQVFQVILRLIAELRPTACARMRRSMVITGRHRTRFSDRLDVRLQRLPLGNEHSCSHAKNVECWIGRLGAGLF
jgi:hypothetical protein